MRCPSSLPKRPDSRACLRAMGGSRRRFRCGRFRLQCCAPGQVKPHRPGRSPRQSVPVLIFSDRVVRFVTLRLCLCFGFKNEYEYPFWTLSEGRVQYRADCVESLEVETAGGGSMVLTKISHSVRIFQISVDNVYISWTDLEKSCFHKTCIATKYVGRFVDMKER